MEFSYSYASSSSVTSGADSSAVSFAPDLKRQPTYFSGKLRLANTFREAVSALHDVVVSDLRFKPKDKSAYKAWLAQHEEQGLVAALAKGAQLQAEVTRLDAELRDLDRRFAERAAPFLEAKKRYFNWLYQVNKDFWFVLDPVITVHPDEIFFECFSQDESSYGRLGASYEYFEDVGELACGTTNVDYSSALYDEFQKIRSYKTTTLTVDPTGFGVKTTNEDAYKEVKIDLPDSWVRGFLQVSSAMSLPAVRFDLHPMDIHNICFVLRRHKETKGPRSMRYHLQPGEPVRVVFEPWEKEVVCPRSRYLGNEPQIIRVWGRRRLHILERLIPVANKFTVHLLGTGMPSFYVADLGDMSFTLGLSGWTANDWSQSGNFDLMAPRADVDEWTQKIIFDALQENWLETADSLAQRLKFSRTAVLGALSAYTQAGRIIYDLNKQVYRVRELSREPLPMERLRFANEREENAKRFLNQNAAQVTSVNDRDGVLVLQGNIRDNEKTYNPSLTIDQDERIIEAECTCNWHQQNKLYKGPCEHILALRMQYVRQCR